MWGGCRGGRGKYKLGCPSTVITQGDLELVAIDKQKEQKIYE